MEEVVLVDQKNNVVGYMEKMEAHEKGLLHRAFSIFIFNTNNELLLQQRAFSKYHSGGLWTNTCCSHPRKQEKFIDAANILSLENPNLKFLLVAPNEKNSLDSVPVSYVRDAEKNGSFKWLEFRKDIFDLCALCDLAVLPSYYKEGGYPRALLEPMALGKPVIAADTRDCRAPVLDGENGFLVPPRDVAKLVERITEICSDKKMRESFGRKSLSLILDEYDDKEVVMKILSEINN